MSRQAVGRRRRKFFNVHTATGSAIVKQALDRIGHLYAVEKTHAWRLVMPMLTAAVRSRRWRGFGSDWLVSAGLR